MKGAVCYHSRYGNNRKVATGIAEGLREAGHQVDLMDVKEGAELGEDVEFLVAGSPTRAGRMSSPLRKFLKKNITGPRRKGMPFAAFGTCMGDTFEKGKSSAAKDISVFLEERNLKPIAGPFDAVVTGFKGPLGGPHEGRAGDFGRELGALLLEDSE